MSALAQFSPVRWLRRGAMPASIPSRLTFRHVSCRYGATLAVDDVSLDIAAGEVVCVLGHSGSGKSTLLRLAAGLERPCSGTIELNERDISAPRSFVPPEKRGVGLMFQDYALFPHLDTLANVMFGLKNLTPAEAEREGRAALVRVGLEEVAHHYPHMLSGGQQQRVALARAVAPRPGVLLFDEPFSGLDRQLRHSVREETLKVIRETRATSMIVTHDAEEAMRMGDRIALMKAGRIIQVGDAFSLYHRPESLFVARFFSELNEMEGRVAQGSVLTPLGRFEADGHADGQKVVVAVRPSGLRIGAAGRGVAGRLIERRFLGEIWQLALAVDGMDAPVCAFLRQDGAVPALRADVGVMVDPAEVLVFEAQEG